MGLGSDLAFVTNNYNDFASSNDPNDSRLHPDHVSDLHRRDFPEDTVMLFHTLQRFIDQKIKPKLEFLDQTLTGLKQGANEGTYPQDAISKRFPKAFQEYFGMSGLFKDVTYKASGADLVASPIEVRRLPSGELLVEALVKVTAEMRFHIEEAKLKAALTTHIVGKRKWRKLSDIADYIWGQQARLIRDLYWGPYESRYLSGVLTMDKDASGDVLIHGVITLHGKVMFTWDPASTTITSFDIRSLQTDPRMVSSDEMA